MTEENPKSRFKVGDVVQVVDEPFYLEDDSMIKRIEQYIENHTGVALHE